jgi:L-iditol 2-dehydrogenase
MTKGIGRSERKMKQAIMTAPGSIEFREVEKPVPAANEVLIRVKKIGVCGSDVHVYHGVHPYTSFPVVQGHEVAGEVESVGVAVKSFETGDKVTFLPQVVCGECYPCKHGMSHICDNLKVMGFQTGGAAQEFFPVPSELCLKLPPDMSFAHGAMIEPTAVAVHALTRMGEVEGKRIVVLGSGPIGNLVAQCAHGLGARDVIVTDLSEFRLEIARTCGVSHTVNVAERDLGDAILEYFGNDKADAIFECIGSGDAIASGISVARKGSTVIVVGVFGQKPVVDLGLVQDRELTLRGTLMYQRADYVTALDLISNGTVRLDPLITDTFSFDDYLRAYKYVETAADRAMKVMIDL